MFHRSGFVSTKSWNGETFEVGGEGEKFEKRWNGRPRKGLIMD